jgi:hypothetical protein
MIGRKVVVVHEAAAVAVNCRQEGVDLVLASREDLVSDCVQHQR